MDFSFTEAQEAVAQAARGVFEGLATPERVAAVEAGDDRVDDELWRALADANLLGLAVPEAHGGSGLGLTELCLVLEPQGRCVAPVPLSAALTEVAAATDRRPVVRAEADGAGWRLTGTAMAVPQAHVAACVVVPAQSAEGAMVVLVDPTGPGARLERAETTDRQVHPHLHLDGAPVASDDVLAGPGAGEAVVEWMVQRATTGLCAVQLGVAEEALARTAAYLNERRQFGRPLSSFQGTLLCFFNDSTTTE